MICTEYNTFGNAPQPYSIPQGINYQETVDFASNLYIGKAAAPDKIWSLLTGSLGKRKFG